MTHRDQALDDLHNTQWFTDARSAHRTVEVDPAGRPKTTFSHDRRLLAVAMSTFQKAMKTVLALVMGRHVLAYLDNVVMYSRTIVDPLEHLEEILDLLNKIGFLN